MSRIRVGRASLRWGRLVVEIGFRSGNTIRIRCRKFEVNGVGSPVDNSYSFDGLDAYDVFQIDLSQAEYVRVVG